LKGRGISGERGAEVMSLSPRFKPNNDQVSAAIWFASGVSIAVASLGYGLGSLSSPGSGFMTFMTALSICFFSLVGFVEATWKQRRGIHWKPILSGLMWEKPIIVLGALTAYALLLPRLGFLLCAALLTAFLLRIVKPQRWVVVFGGGILASLGCYVIFELWLKAQLPKGPWGF
jgi:putative tricarboxylic transport membrane protein